MTPLIISLTTANGMYDTFHCMNFKIIYQPHGQLLYKGSISLEKKIRKKIATEGVFFFPFVLKPILLYHSFL